MFLTPEQQAVLNGSKGETMAKVMKTLVMYGETFGADKMVPVTSEYNHLVTSFGLKMMGPVFDLQKGAYPTSARPFPLFPAHPEPWQNPAFPDHKADRRRRDKKQWHPAPPKNRFRFPEYPSPWQKKRLNGYLHNISFTFCNSSRKLIPF